MTHPNNRPSEKAAMMCRAQAFAAKILPPAFGLTKGRGTTLTSSRTGRFLVVSLILSTLSCSKPPASAPKAHLSPEVKVVNVAKRTIVHVTGQPGFIEAYEQTSIYPKISGFIDYWKVDIGDSITKNMVLAHLDVPDLVAEYEEKKADVELDEVRIKVADKFVNVSLENLNKARAQVDQAKANLGTNRADVARWTVGYERIHGLAERKAIDETVEDESRKHLQSSIASQSAAESGIVVDTANAAALKADVAKARIDVDAARARAKVSRATARRLAALVGYTTVQAPYDGIVVTRNVNTGDYAQPAAGDQSAARNNPGASRASSNNPLYVVARTDKVRIFLDVPEMEANGIHPGSKAHVKIEAVDNMEFATQVTRTSWALNAKSRTLRAEIDIPNPGRRILPNMYAYGTVELSRVGVWAVPLQAVFQLGNQDYCYVLEQGKAVQLAVQVGIDDGTWVEVTKKRSKVEWLPFNGTERLIVGELSQLHNSELVRVSASAPVQK
jgi:HlyD family secretion protein